MEGSSSVKIFGTICVSGPQCTPSYVTFPEGVWEIEYFGYGSDSHWRSDMSGHTEIIFHTHINKCACNKGNMLWFEVGLKDRGGVVFCHRMVEAIFPGYLQQFLGCWLPSKSTGGAHWWEAIRLLEERTGMWVLTLLTSVSQWLCQANLTDAAQWWPGTALERQPAHERSHHNRDREETGQKKDK